MDGSKSGNETNGVGGDHAEVATEKKVRIGILTVSDRCSRGEIKDESGPAIQEAIGIGQFIVAVYACIEDDRKTISRTLRRWADDELCDCILTTGGTGLSERDVTPEATERVLDQQIPALSLYLTLEGMKTVPTAVLSRGASGARGKTLIVNLPGSPNGARQGAKLLVPIISHAIEVLQKPSASVDHPIALVSGTADALL